MVKSTTRFLAALTILAALTASYQREATGEAPKPRVDLFGDSLPDEAIARIGSMRLRHGNLIHRLVFSPDGKSLVSGAWGGIRIWDTETGKLRQRFDFEHARIYCSDVVFRSDGLMLASAGYDKRGVTIRLLDPASGKVRWRSVLAESVSQIQPKLSCDGKRIAFSPDKTSVRIYDTATGRETLRIPVSGNIVPNLAFARDGKSIALQYDTDTIHLCDTANGKKRYEIKRKGHPFSKLVYSPDGRLLASISIPAVGKETEPTSVTLWDAATSQERHRLRSFFGLLVFSPDSKTLAILCENGETVFWDTANGKELRRFALKREVVIDLAFSPDGKVLAASHWGTVRLLDAATGHILPASGDTSLDIVTQLRFSGDSKRLIGRADAFTVWETGTGREIRRFAKIPSAHMLLPLSPDESLLVSADKDGTIRLLDARTGKAIRTLRGHQKTIRRMIFSADGRRLVSSSEDGTIRLWDVPNGQEVKKLAGEGERTMRLAISPDGRWLASPSKSQVILWDLTAGKEKTRFALNGIVFSDEIAFSPDSRLLAATVAGGGTFQIWDVTTGERRLSFTWQKASIHNIAFSTDNRMLATSDGEGSLILWELASGQKRHQFVGHENLIYSIAFSPNGRMLAASSFDVPAYVWDVAGTIGHLHHPLSNEELRRYWAALAGDDAASAFQAIRRLAAAPGQTLPFLCEKLKPVPVPDQKRIRQLVERLDSEDFQTRQKAAEELEKQNDAAPGLLRQIMANEKPSLEVRRRLQQIVESIESKPESLRAVRAVEVLEWMATPDAGRFISQLASGAADARLTREAVAAKRRLQR